MKINTKILTRMPLLAAVVGLLLAGHASAQSFTSLHEFSPLYGNFDTNTDGARPLAGLAISANTLYGTTTVGGDWGEGTVFAVNTDGSSFTNLHSFTRMSSISSNATNSDGATPVAGLMLSGTTLYGTTTAGGNFGGGAVFRVNTDGTDFTNLHSFRYGSNDGGYPEAGLILSGNTLYGTTMTGGSSNSGVVFKISTDGTGYTNLYSFTAVTGYYLINSDGANPRAGLVLSGNTLYGTTTGGGNPGPGQGSGVGTLFSLNTDGTGFTNLHNFVNNDDQVDSPWAGLVISGNTLYGTTLPDGGSDYGTVFAIHTDGTDFTNLHRFTAEKNDGSTPYGGLALSGGILYGTTSGGGGVEGLVFAINLDGTGFTNLYGFSGGSDGGAPQAGVIISGNTLYGTTGDYGTSAMGTVFRLGLSPGSPPQLAVIHSGANLVFNWPASATGFILQTNGDLAAPNWNACGGDIITSNGTNSVTITPSAGNLFFRLVAP